MNYLAPYAANPEQSLGRHFEEPAAATRNALSA